MSAPLGTRRATLERRIRLLVGATITYNVIEAVVALAEGTRVSSSALIGFGLDSVVEISSAAAVAWQFSAKDPETREKATLRFIAFSFFALAAYVAVDAVLSLLGLGEARPSLIGIVLAAASLVIMPVLSLAQRRAGRELGSLSAVADSKQTLLVHLPLRGPVGGSGAQQPVGMVVGRPRRRPRHRRDCGARRPERLARGPVLLMRSEQRPANRRARIIRCLRGARIRLAQLGTTTPHRIDGLPRRQRAAGFGGMVRRSRLRRRDGGRGRRARSAAGRGGVAGGRLHAPWIQTTGIVIAVIGIVATVYAQLDMGDSWRIGVDPSETTTLVRTGVFGWVRNPIFTAMITFGFGIALVTPNLVALAGFLLLVATIELQVRIVEEPYLLTVHGDAYATISSTSDASSLESGVAASAERTASRDSSPAPPACGWSRLSVTSARVRSRSSAASLPIPCLRTRQTVPDNVADQEPCFPRSPATCWRGVC